MESSVFLEDLRPIELSLEHVERIVAVHSSAFNGFFLTSLGFHFLKTYYSSCLKSELTIAIGLFDRKGNMYGFALGSINSSGYHKSVILKNSLPFFLCLVKVAIRNPKKLLRLFLNLRKGADISDNGDYAELLSIAVLPSFKGVGAGKILIDCFEEKVRNRGQYKIALTTDYYNNDAVLHFYAKSNYRVFYDFIAYPNRRMYKMVKDLI